MRWSPRQVARRTAPALVIGLIAIWLTGCAPKIETIPGDPTPAHAEARDGAFKLAFDLPKRTWAADEAIQGTAALALVDGVAQDLGRSGMGVFGFGFTSTDGSHDMGPVSTADCAPDRLVAGVPMISAIRKSGGFSRDQPDAAFVGSFLSDPLVHLPPGDWKIVAFADFVEGQGCSGASHHLQAQVVIHVTP